MCHINHIVKHRYYFYHNYQYHMSTTVEVAVYWTSRSGSSLSLPPRLCRAECCATSPLEEPIRKALAAADDEGLEYF